MIIEVKTKQSERSGKWSWTVEEDGVVIAVGTDCLSEYSAQRRAMQFYMRGKGW